jgi:hypothetical protein
MRMHSGGVTTSKSNDSNAFSNTKSPLIAALLQPKTPLMHTSMHDNGLVLSKQFHIHSLLGLLG